MRMSAAVTNVQIGAGENVAVFMSQRPIPVKVFTRNMTQINFGKVVHLWDGLAMRFDT